MSRERSTASQPLVSIIVPSFNQGNFIRRTLESILAQEYRPIEVLVIDGASTDATLSILQDFGNDPEIRWTSEPDSGVVEAVNKGFARAQGDIGAIQSSDDFYLPGAVTAAVEALRGDPALAFVYGDIAKVDAAGGEISRTRLAPFTLEGVLSFETWIPQPSTFFRLELAKSLGGWREEVPYAADTDLWLRMAFIAPVKKLDRLMAQRSVHEAQRDTQGARVTRDYAAAIDSLAPLQRAPRNVRRAAAAGKLLLANRYGYDETGTVKLMRLWKAALIYPRLFSRFPVGSFVPGWYRVREALARGFRSDRGVE